MLRLTVCVFGLLNAISATEFLSEAVPAPILSLSASSEAFPQTLLPLLSPQRLMKSPKYELDQRYPKGLDYKTPHMAHWSNRADFAIPVPDEENGV